MVADVYNKPTILDSIVDGKKYKIRCKKSKNDLNEVIYYLDDIDAPQKFKNIVIEASDIIEGKY